MEYDSCPSIAPFLGYMGVLCSVVFANVGAAAGTAKAGTGILKAGLEVPEQIWRNLIPIVMAGVNGIYGLITAIILINSISRPSSGNYNTYSLYSGAAHLAAGLCCGLSGLGSGFCIGIAGDAAVQVCGAHEILVRKSVKRIGDAAVQACMAALEDNDAKGKPPRATKKPPPPGGGDKLFVTMVLVQVFAGNIALYGLIASVILSQQIFYCGDNTGEQR